MGQPCWSYRPKKIAVPVGEGRAVMVSVQQGLRERGIEVRMAKLCRWFGVARRTMYYKLYKAPPKLQEPSFWSQAGTTLVCFEAMVCAGSSSPGTAHSRTTWWSGSSGP